MSMYSMVLPLRSEAAPGNVELTLDAEHPIVIGRHAPGDPPPPYLDPAYHTTNLTPDGRPVVSHARDRTVSRAHLMIQAADDNAIRIINGVPSAENPGTFRASKNSTWITLPGMPEREMGPGEVVVVPPGSSATIRLPNGVTFQVSPKAVAQP
jgi:hypothetical protein